MADINLMLEAERRGILPPAQKGLLDEARRRGLVAPTAGSEEFASRAAAMDPTDIPIARSKNDEFGVYLRGEAKRRKPGETDDQYFKRTGGSLSQGGNVGTGEGLLRAYAQGGTFGAGDELTAATGATVDAITGRSNFGTAYDQRLNAERARLDRFRETDPVKAYGAEVAGAIPTALAAPQLRVMQGTSYLPTVANAVINAGGQGAVYGFNAGEGSLADRLMSGAQGAGIGAVAGGGVSALTPFAARLANNGAEWLLRRGAAERSGMPRAAYDAVTRALEADDALAGVGRDRIRNAGTGAMVADAGPTARGLLDTAVQRGGPAAREAMTAIEGRAANAGRDVTRALDDALGAPHGVATTEAALRTGTAGARRAAYDAAYAIPVNYADDAGRQIEQIVRTRVPASAIREANELMRIAGDESGQILANVADDGTVTFQRLPDIRQLDYLTRAINAVAQRTDTAGAMGGQTAKGSALQNLSRELRGLMRQSVPEYGQALDTAAGPIEARQALQLGREILSPRMARDEVAIAIDGMSAAERASVAQGVRSQIDETLANVRRTISNPGADAHEAQQALRAVRDLSSQAARDKLETLLGPRAAPLFSELDRAATALELRSGVTQNSRTFARTAVDDAVRAQTQEGPVNAALQGKPIELGRSLIQALTGRGPAGQQRMADETYQAIVRVLTGPRGADAIRLLQQLELEQAHIGSRGQGARSLAERLLMPTPAITAPTRENVWRR